MLEEKGAKLFGLTRVLDENLKGTYTDLLLEKCNHNQLSSLDREDKIRVLSEILFPFTDMLAAAFPGVGVGYYCRELDAILTYGPGKAYRDRVGISVDNEHIGRKAMARRKEIVGVGSMVRGEIMNCVRPLIRGEDAIGFVWANETIEDIYKQTGQGAKRIFFSSDIQPVLGLTGLLLFTSKLLVQAGSITGSPSEPMKEQLPWTANQMQQYLKTFLNSLNIGITIVDAGNKVIFVNRMLGQILGIELDSLPREYYGDYRIFLDRIGFKEVGNISDKLLANNQTQYFSKSTVVLPDGQIRELNYIIAFMSGRHGLPDDMPGKVILFEDLESSREEAKRLERADKLATLGELAASIAHEIRNPLAIVLGSLQLLPQRLGDRDFVYSFLRIATQELVRVNNSIEALLDFARFSKPEFATVDMNALLQETLNFFAVTLDSQGIKIEQDFSTELPLIEADGKQLKQCILNIVLNSIHAMPGGGTIQITTHYRKGDKFIRVIIADTGCGISNEHQAHIFDAFYSTKEKGTGLGLSLVHRVIDEHQGIIEFKSRVGQGTTFYLHLPIRQFNLESDESKFSSGREVL